MDCSHNTLSDLQRRLLYALRGVEGAWLSGGSALGGFYLGHRASYDLDWFCDTPSRLEEISKRLRTWCSDVGAVFETEQEYPGFRRHRVVLAGDSTIVDLVHEPTAQVVALDEKPIVEGIRVDPIPELLANKLVALLGRGETKDLVDLYFLAQAGFDPLSGLEDAARKDGGMEPATLAWVLSQVSVRTGDLLLCRPVDEANLASFRDSMVTRLQRLAWPSPR